MGVYNTKSSRPLSREGQNESERAMSPRSQQEKSEPRTIHIKNLSKQQSKEQLAYKPPIGKKNSDEGLPSLPTGLKTEDSDNDSAVSSGRSSLSGRSSSPPQSPKAIRNELREKMQNNNNSNIDLNPRMLKKNSVEAINRQNVINACKKSSATPISDINLAYTKEELKNAELAEPPLETSSPRNNRTCGRPASRSSSFTIAERRKSFESQQSESSSSRRGSNSSQDSLSRRSSRDAFETNTNSRRSSREVMEEVNSRRSSRVTTPTGNSNYPDSILDIEEKVAYMSDVVDRASSATPTERRSLSRTNSIASERSTYSSRSSRNSSIMSKDSAISEDISKEAEVRDKKLPEENLNKKSSNTDNVSKWSELEKKYSKGLSSNSIGEKISKLSKTNAEETKNERPKDLAIAHKKISNGINSPGSKNFKELAEKWQTISIDTPIYSPTSQNTCMSSTLPRKSSKEKVLSSPLTSPDFTPSTLPRKHSREKSPC